MESCNDAGLVRWMEERKDRQNDVKKGQRDTVMQR